MCSLNRQKSYEIENSIFLFDLLSNSRWSALALESSIFSCKELAMANTEAAPSSNKTWRLTLYEQNRTPQQIITDDTEIKVSPRSLHSELMCPICLDMLKNTMTTKECLHRFCQECITTALRSGNKECPTCRKKLVSRRSLRADPTFDALIAKIYPNRAEYEAHQERVLAKMNKHHSTDALMNSIEEGMPVCFSSASRCQDIPVIRMTLFSKEWSYKPSSDRLVSRSHGRLNDRMNPAIWSEVIH